MPDAAPEAPAAPPATTTVPPPGNAPSGGLGGGGWGFLILPVFLIGMVFLMSWPERRQQKKRKALLDALKKNDRVVTVGGVHGIVTAVDEDTVVLRIDESQDVRVRFARGSIQTVKGKDGKDGKDKEEKKEKGGG